RRKGELHAHQGRYRSSRVTALRTRSRMPRHKRYALRRDSPTGVRSARFPAHWLQKSPVPAVPARYVHAHLLDQPDGYPDRPAGSLPCSDHRSVTEAGITWTSLRPTAPQPPISLPARHRATKDPMQAGLDAPDSKRLRRRIGRDPEAARSTLAAPKEPLPEVPCAVSPSAVLQRLRHVAGHLPLR